MTTPAAANLYLAQHLYEMEGKGYAVFNPLEKPIEQLPVIYGFNNGGSRDWLTAVAMAQDGTVLGQHICSNEAYMPHDLGVLAGSREDRHRDQYQVHYPEGYRMEFVGYDEFPSHEGLKAACILADEKSVKAEEGK